MPSLKQLLEHPGIAKIGNNVAGDVTKMRKDYLVDTQHWVDLGQIANIRVGNGGREERKRRAII